MLRTIGVRQIVHLKLSPEFPPEVQEAALVRQDDGGCQALIRLRKDGGTVEVTVPLAPCGQWEPAAAVPEGKLDVGWRQSPPYQRLMDALKRLSRSME